ncbi:secretory lipase [Gemmatirosa kalamazoonensis]|uniref:Secretory lipase n=1 Tax=Gemmatirosa kalamazoonensis TaxID=861299 RepID=W0RFX9_9BACT|nr:lipase family protein [Gemmatirosa kalamazoonensis]AHG88298.1 secretory lipase [Gemmatirosa kalamazoonensis]
MLAAARHLTVAALVTLAACSSDAVVAPPIDGGSTGLTVTVPAAPAPNLAGRGDLVSSSAGPRTPRVLVATTLALTGASRAFSARYDAQPYVVRYRTPNVEGQLVTASGAVWIPVGATGALPLVVYTHGTETSKSEAPSNLLGTAEGDVFGALYASDGSVVAEPDYLGLGVAGAGQYHPYLHVQSEASAAVDLLRAARALATQLGTPLAAGSLFVTGYSQGGGAAMGLFRELERNYATEFPVLGAAPMSGPYDLESTARTMLERNEDYHVTAVYTAYLTATLDTVYRMAPKLSDLIAPPYDVIAAHLRDGVATSGELAQLPSHARDVLRADVVQAMLANKDHPFWAATRDNNTYDWTPRAPLRIYYGGADKDVYPANALTAETRMRANGARNVAAVNVGANLDHAGAVLPATIAGRIFLDSLRRGLIAR